MRIRFAVMGMALGGVALAATAHAQTTSAQTATTPMQVAQAQTSTEPAPPPRRPRARVRIYREPEDERGVYPRYNPGPDAVRDCTATYVEEHRPSGTVITPHMNCFWRRG